MVLSNEPGYYKKNEFGIRIENLMAVQKSEKMPGFMGFKRLTLIPYDRNLIEKGLLSPPDIAHIDSFHAEIHSKLAPFLEENSPQQQLLTWATSPL